MAETFDRAFAIRAYYGSSREMTTMLYQHLSTLGPAGELAVNLMRAAKTSERAKKYRGGDRGGSYRRQSYGTKQWALGNICRVLVADYISANVTVWGWGVDQALFQNGDPHYHVLYVEIPTGQVSFHTDQRGDGPDYTGEWDRARNTGPDRILRWVGRVLGEKAEAA